MKKHFFQGQEQELTDEEKQQIRELEAKQEQERNELLAKQSDKKVVVNYMNPLFVPHEDRVLVYPDQVASVTAGGIHVPDEVIERAKPLKGTVVRVGPGKAGTKYIQKDGTLNDRLPLAEGDRIVYGNYAGTEFEILGIKYLIMRFADIFGHTYIPPVKP